MHALFEAREREREKEKASYTPKSEAGDAEEKEARSEENQVDRYVDDD